MIRNSETCVTATKRVDCTTTNMNTSIKEPLSVIGKRMERVTSMITETHPNTGDPIFRFFLHLSNNVIVDLLFGEIRFCEDIPADVKTAQLRVMDGAPSIDGEEIVAVIEQGLPRDNSDNTPRQLAIILSSGRAAMNVYLCGGGNVLHVESVYGLIRYNGKEWSDLWSNERVEVDRFGHVSA